MTISYIISCYLHAAPFKICCEEERFYPEHETGYVWYSLTYLLVKAAQTCAHPQDLWHPSHCCVPSSGTVCQLFLDYQMPRHRLPAATHDTKFYSKL